MSGERQKGGGCPLVLQAAEKHHSNASRMSARITISSQPSPNMSHLLERTERASRPWRALSLGGSRASTPADHRNRDQGRRRDSRKKRPTRKAGGTGPRAGPG